MTTVITLIITFAVLSWLFRSVSQAHAVERLSGAQTGVLVFGGSAAVRWTMIACTFILVGIGVAAFVFDENRTEGMWIGLGFALFGMTGVFAIPADIEISEQGISSKHWWGGAKSLRWQEVSGISGTDVQKPVKVIGTNGTKGVRVKIVHTIMNVDRERFIAEVNKRRPSGAGAGQ
jgi:hypothetical protein